MPLSEDQRAMLRLLAQREQGYDDLAALMGLSVAEVRAKVKDALAQLEEEGEAPPPLPAEPVRAEPPSQPEAPSEPEPPTEPVREQPAPPPVPAAAAKPEPAAPRAAAPAASRTKPQRPRVSLPESGGARAALAAGVAVVVALVVVLAVSGGGDSGGTTTAASSEGTTASEETTGNAAANPKLTQAVLSPIDGGDAKGLATFGRVKNSLALQIEAEGLEPTAKGQSYTIWLYESAQKMLPLASTAVPKSGKIAAQVQVPTEVLAYLAKETFDQLDVSLTDETTLKASLAKATKEKKAPLYTGTDVLRGTIVGPIIGAANKK